jgi:hypothetical protein
MVQGKVAILAIAFLGVAASVGSFFYYARLQHRPLALWGPEQARLMLRAPKALAYQLEAAPEVEPAAGANVIEIGGQRLRLVDERDVTQSPGFSHIRQSFVHDASFDWDAPADDCQPRWTHALRFIEGEQSATILLAFNCARAALADDPAAKIVPDQNWPPRSVSIKPVSAAIEEFFVELDPKTPPAKR